MKFVFQAKSQNTALMAVFWLLNLSVSGQTISGRVLSSFDSIPVPFATLSNQAFEWGLTANEDGTFKTNQLKEGDTLIISSLGYYQARIPYYELHNNVRLFLNVRPVQLDEVKISKTARMKDVWLGSKQNTPNSIIGTIGMSTIREIALLIPNFTQSKGLIRKVGYYIGRLGKPKTPFRIRIYKNDNGMPGDDLLNQSVVVHASRGNSWRDVDLSAYKIPFPAEGFFIAMEWLLVPNKKYHYELILRNGEIADRFGQSAGATNEFEPGYGRIRNNGGKWEAYPYGSRNNLRPMFRAQVRVYE